MRERTRVMAAAAFEVDEAIVNQLSAYPLIELGVGPLRAVQTCERKTCELADCHVIFIGTCGAFKGFDDEVKTVTASQVSFQSVGERLKHSYPVAGCYPVYQLDCYAPSLDRYHVICSSDISLNATLDPAASTFDSVENLELYSAVSVLNQVVKRWTVVLGITNSIGEGAHAAWKRHAATARERASAYLGSAAFISGLAKL